MERHFCRFEAGVCFWEPVDCREFRGERRERRGECDVVRLYSPSSFTIPSNRALFVAFM